MSIDRPSDVGDCDEEDERPADCGHGEGRG